MKKATWLIIFLAGLLHITGFSQTRKKSGKASKSIHSVKKKKPARKSVARLKPRKTSKVEYGTASFYSNRFIGRKTASGETFSQKKLTAAHNSAPLGSYLRITSIKTRKSVIVKVTDRLHKRNRRIVDLTRAVAQKLGNSGKGLIKVKVELLGQKSK
ncbi:MAG: septal ring lytic transglycosylase RlpA family protein [Chitinophagaceae bacterium]